MKTEIVTVLTFGDKGNAKQNELYGWFHGESGFTWTLGGESAISLPNELLPFGGIIEVDVIPLLLPVGPKQQRLSLSINGKFLGGATLTTSAVLGFEFPPLNVLDRAMITTIGHPDCVREVPNSPPFAFAFRRLRVLRKLAPCDSGDNSSRESLGLDVFCSAEVLHSALYQKYSIALGDLMSSFQLISGDCEFGGVQRLCGVEPLGLLRFAGASPETALTLLDNNFSEIGTQISAYVAEHGEHEWMVRDHLYKLNYHTRLPSSSYSEEDVIRAERRKVSFLRRCLIDDLLDGAKIFVCADRQSQPVEAMLPLFASLNRFHRNKLLWIVEADDGSQAGRVDQVMPGLYRGYINSFAQHGTMSTPSLSGWAEVLLNAYILSNDVERDE